AYPPNPVGRGWHREENVGRLNGQPLPNLERPGTPVRVPWDNAAPAAFGPLGRGWRDRLRYAGTYDDHWQEEVFPFLPADFDTRYFQAAPEDQQIDPPAPGTEVLLRHLTHAGTTAFRLPETRLPITFGRRKQGDHQVEARPDTIVIRPDDGVFTLSWRASLPLARDLFEISDCIIGRRPKGFWRARKMGKRYYPKLSRVGGPARTEDAA
ncbi:MAG: DUF2169 domain-containing protein, partial [Pseudomonadota bacterium]